jgi:hypothetical protein
MRGGRGAAVASSIEEVVAVAVHTPPLMALQQVAASVWGWCCSAFACTARLLDSSQLCCGKQLLTPDTA